MERQNNRSNQNFISISDFRTEVPWNFRTPDFRFYQIGILYLITPIYLGELSLAPQADLGFDLSARNKNQLFQPLLRLLYTPQSTIAIAPTNIISN